MNGGWSGSGPCGADRGFWLVCEGRMADKLTTELEILVKSLNEVVGTCGDVRVVAMMGGGRGGVALHAVDRSGIDEALCN